MLAPKATTFAILMQHMLVQCVVCELLQLAVIGDRVELTFTNERSHLKQLVDGGDVPAADRFQP